MSSARRAVGDDAAVVDDGDPVAEPLGLVHVVGGEEHGAAAGLEAVHDVPHLPARLRDRGRWWARPGTAAPGRPPGRRPRRGAASARRRACPPGRRPSRVRPTSAMTSSGGPAARGRTRRNRSTVSPTCSFSESTVCWRQTPRRSRIARSSLPQRRPSTDHLAGGRLEQPLEDLDRGRLARAVRAEQAEALAGRDLEGDPAHGLHRAVALAEVAHDDGGRPSILRRAAGRARLVQ